jgi:hypothetical protein
MRRRFLATLLGLLTSAASVPAQPPVAPQGQKELLIVVDPASGQAATKEVQIVRGPAAGVPSLVGPEDVFWSALPPPVHDSIPECGTVWLSADYLVWWMRHAPISAPLVTTGSLADPVPGALGQKNTAVVFGNESVDLGTFSGFRVALGFALGGGWSVEGGYFGLESRVGGASFNSDANGNPVIARPYFDNQAGTQAAYLDAIPGLLSGGASVAIVTRMFGYEANAAWIAYLDDSMRFDVLAGFRGLELHEELRIIDNVSALVPGQLTFLGAPADPPNVLNIFERFHNYNRFYGGQIGGRFHWLANGLDVGITGKLALGATSELARVDSATSLITPGVGAATNPGGVLVQPSNVGFPQQCHFAYVPEIAIDLAYWVTPHIRLEVGYQFLYWSQVARPGDEIDTTVNPAQVPRDPRFGNGLGDPRPAFQFHQSDFWAQGFHFGVLFQY